jgi:hypothetical protein
MPIPAALEPSWKFIYNEVVDIHLHWKFFEQLFGRGQRRLDLLNECAPNFFYLVQDAMLLVIQLRLCKFGDPAATGKNQNMTLAKLRDEIQSQGDPDSGKMRIFITRLDACLADYGAKCGKVRIRRNKFLAHTDQLKAMNVVPLLGPTRQEIDDALDSLRIFMRAVEDYFAETPIAYNHVLTIHDGEAVVTALKYNLRYMELQHAEVFPYFDYEKSPWANA